jgi:PAS domain S-box-containing protein
MSLGNIRILVVGNTTPVAKEVCDALLGLGCVICDVVSLTSDVMVQIEKSRPAIILVLGNDEVKEFPKFMEAQLQIPIVCICTSDDGLDMSEIRVEDMHGYVRYPVETDILESVIKLALYRIGLEKKLISSECLLSKSEKRFTDLVEFMDEGFLMLNSEMKIEYINPSAERIFGWSSSEVACTPISNYLDATNMGVFREQQEMRRNAKISRYELSLDKRDGSRLTISILGYPVFNVQGEYSGAYGIFTDITESRRIEKLIRESEARYRSIVQYARSGVVVYEAVDGGTDFVIIDFNESAEKFEKISKEDVIGKRIRQVFPGAEEFGLFDILKEVWRTGDTTHQPLVFYKDNVRSGWREIFVYKLPSGEVVVVYTDQTSRKDAEAQIMSQNAFLNDVINSLSHPFYVINVADYTVQIANSAAYSENVSRSDKCYEIAHKEALPCPEMECMCPLREVLRTKKSLVVEHIHYNIDETPHYVEVHAHPIFDSHGDVIQVIKYCFDVTARKLMEEEKQRMEHQLHQIQKVDAIGALASGIAHDFNNILSPILGYAEISLTELPKESTSYSDMQEIRKAGLRARDLIEQILSFSRQSEQKVRPMKLSTVVKSALRLLRALIPTTIDIQLEIASNAVDSRVRADTTQIYQILMNLCTNASHAMKFEDGAIYINLQEKEIGSMGARDYPDLKHGTYLELSISDTGTGMPPDVQDHIFEPYFTTKPQGEGTGLGLSIVFGIITSYAGSISVHSEWGKGATFNILIPKTLEPELPEDEIFHLDKSASEKVLVVDDEEIVLTLECRMLEKMGYHPVPARTGFEALEIFNSNPNYFDVVMTDQTMPYMTGLELSQEIRKIRPELPVILCTGYSKKVDEKGLREAGIRGFIAKPLSIKGLKAVISDVLESTQQNRDMKLT